ncbi:MAG: BatD family protein [Prevotellaceae bacterium]|nr:BatD family protein [Prevotellaceae bacterium]
MTALLLSLPFLLRAQVKVTINAPSQAIEGQRVQVSYTVNTQSVEDIQVGDFQGFDLLYGPTASRQSSYSIINGKSSSSSSITYTYTLEAKTAGTYKLPVATVTSGGKPYKSNTKSIQVLPDTGGGAGSSQGGSQGGATRMRTQDTGDKITDKDLYITVTASKTNVYEQEAILLTYKLYTLVSIDQCEGKMPDLDGFLIQELPLPQQKELKYENVNGKTYGTVVWSQYVLFPQQTGKLKVPALSFEAQVVQQDRTVDPFDAFFGGGSTLRRVKKTVVAPAVELQVNPLPPRPAGFSGAVGTDFHISGTLTPEQVDANDAVQLRLVVSGTGNMKLMNAPAVDWPKDFETYDPKTDDKTKIGTTGTTGNIVYDYTAVPRHGGKYVIPAVRFCYFDTSSKTYKTIRTDSFTLAVAKTASKERRSEVNQEDLRVLNDDIRYIKIGSRRGQSLGTAFFATGLYYGAYALLLLLFILVVAVHHALTKANSNVARTRRKKAGKAAAKRLKTASQLLRQAKAEAFYDEVMRALWGYVSDKLNLPPQSLSKDNVGEQLRLKGVDEELTGRFLKVLEDCEFVRFAPGDPEQAMDKLYADATDVINLLDTKL